MFCLCVFVDFFASICDITSPPPYCLKLLLMEPPTPVVIGIYKFIDLTELNICILQVYSVSTAISGAQRPSSSRHFPRHCRCSSPNFVLPSSLRRHKRSFLPFSVGK